MEILLRLSVSVGEVDEPKSGHVLDGILNLRRRPNARENERSWLRLAANCYNGRRLDPPGVVGRLLPLPPIMVKGEAI